MNILYLSRPQTATHTTGLQAMAGFGLLSLSMGLCAIAGAIAGGARDVVLHSACPAWAADRGLGTLAATALVLGLATVTGQLGWRQWTQHRG